MDPSIAPPATANPPHVILAEDDNVLAELCQRLLQKAGFSVVAVADGDELTQAIELKRPDLILLDIMIPGMSGFDLLRMLKDHAWYKDIPVIMLSARGSERDQVQAFDFGAVDFLRKPFRFEDLVTRAKRAVASQRATAQDRGTP
ncbi:MAG: response regulator [Rhodospirillaceae bacterium]|nr:response regulator [Rhodospirillaceae bacterium]